MVEWYWHGKIRSTRTGTCPSATCPPNIPHGLACHWTGASAVKGSRFVAWAMARHWLNASLRGRYVAVTSSTSLKTCIIIIVIIITALGPKNLAVSVLFYLLLCCISSSVPLSSFISRSLLSSFLHLFRPFYLPTFFIPCKSHTCVHGHVSFRPRPAGPRFITRKWA
jgi:hypothetical protein